MLGTMRGRFVYKAAAVLTSAALVSGMNGVVPVYAEERGAAISQLETGKAASDNAEKSDSGIALSEDLVAYLDGTTLTIAGTGELDVDAMLYIRDHFYKKVENVKFTGHVCAPKSVSGLFGDGFFFRTLKKIDLTNLDTSDVENMSYWFRSDPSTAGEFTKTIVFPEDFDTSNVETMFGMLENGANIRELDLTNFHITDSVEYMGIMFAGCSSLERIVFNDDVDTSNVCNMAGMFEGCSNLKELDLSMFDTSEVESAYNFFKGCEKLKKVDLSSFDTSYVSYYDSMFEGCSSLEELDISSFDMYCAESAEDMFKGCSFKKLVTPDDVPEEFDVELPETMYDKDGNTYTKLPESSVTISREKDYHENNETPSENKVTPSENIVPVGEENGDGKKENTQKTGIYFVGAGKVDVNKYLGITNFKGIKFTSTNKKLASVNRKGIARLKGRAGEVTVTAIDRKTKAVKASYTMHLIVPDIKTKKINVKQDEVKNFKMADCINCDGVKPVLASSNPGVAEVDNETGEVKITGKGTAVVYVVYNGSSLKDRFGSRRRYKVRVKVG